MIIAYENCKLAAAYFDCFIPFPGSKNGFLDIFELKDYLLSRKSNELAWQEIGIPQEFIPYFHVVAHLSNIDFLSIKSGKDPRDCVQSHYDSLGPTPKRVFDSLLGNPKHMADHQYEWGDIWEAATDYHSRPFIKYPIEYFGSTVSQRFTDSDDPIMQIASIPVIQSEKLKWEVVRELRNDKSSQTKLRRLRAFVFEKYAGKPMSFIEDDLLSRIDDHQNAAKDWGLATVQATFSVSATKGLMTAAASGLIAAMSGQSIPIAAAIGACAVIGPTTVSILTSRKRFRLKQDSDPVAYVVDLINSD